MTRIIGLSGKKTSGKNTACNHLAGIKLKSKGLIDDFRLSDSGELHTLVTNSEGVQDWGELDLTRTDDEFVESAQTKIWPYVKLYSFSEALKAMCVNLLEIPYDQIYGTDEQKNELTHLLWEDMPGVLTPDQCSFMYREDGGGGNTIDEIEPSITDDDFNGSNFEGVLHWNGLCIHQPGPMTGREVMQYFGTDVMRRIYGPVWINNTLKRIAAEQPELALLTDVRFANEADGVLGFGGELIRLSREPFSGDQHSSETQLDSENYDRNKFTFLIDNAETPISFLQERLDKIYMGEIKKVEFTGFKTSAG